MKKTTILCLVLFLVAFLPMMAAAATVPFPDGLVEISVPDTWKQATKEKAMVIEAPDKEMSVVFFAIDGDSNSASFDVVDNAVEKEIGAVKWEKDGKGVAEEINGMKGEIYNGTAKEGALQVECIWLVTGPNKNLYIYWFDTPESEKKYQKDIETIVKGLKPLAKASEKKEEKPEEKK